MSEPMAVKPEVAALLRRVKRRILAQPKRLDMARWGARKAPDEGGPACGTVACIAGWIALDGMTIPEAKGLTRGRLRSLMNRAPQIAEKAIGVPIKRLDYGGLEHILFFVEDWPSAFSQRYYSSNGDAGKAASATAERIEHFIRTGE